MVVTADLVEHLGGGDGPGPSPVDQVEGEPQQRFGTHESAVVNAVLGGARAVRRAGTAIGAPVTLSQARSDASACQPSIEVISIGPSAWISARVVIEFRRTSVGDMDPDPNRWRSPPDRPAELNVSPARPACFGSR
ncbi:hypothetical protein BLA60_28060 [Actinophytocola xinjiangensis]|uniref:Uncharacterized protein n=1 Tax=Actinophytocola xinjiangensis TaxID=485602 RepID=A0A7Z0WKY7_9PSEU|nr:hypothetical protein BLA60_28060 [Actinophytocola xinjiangensis]